MTVVTSPVQTLLAAITDIAEDAIIIIDQGQRIVLFNRGAERLFDYTAGEVIGENLSLLIPERFRPNHGDHIRAFGASSARSRLMSDRSDIAGAKKDGSEFLAEASISKATLPGPNGDAELYYSVVLRDVSSRRKMEAEREAAFREKELLLNEVHHRVKNNLQIISSLLSLQADSQTEPDVIAALTDAQTRVRSISLIHERLYRSGNFAAINFAQYARELGQHLLSTLHTAGAVSLTVHAGEITLGLDQAIPCGLILNELITNSLKHGFATNRCGTIAVGLTTLSDGRLELSVADSGAGLPVDFDMLHSSTLGIQLIVSLAAQLGGELEYSQGEPGLVVRVRFPATSRES